MAVDYMLVICCVDYCGSRVSRERPRFGLQMEECKQTNKALRLADAYESRRYPVGACCVCHPIVYNERTRPQASDSP